MHFGTMAWPSTILRIGKLWISCGLALRLCSRCNTRDCLSWVVKNWISSSLPSKQLASEPMNSFSPPPYSCRRALGRCTSSAAFSKLWVHDVNSRRFDLVQGGKLSVVYLRVSVPKKEKREISNTYILNGAVM